MHPDPLEILYDYADPRDQEIAGLIAACLAYGRVAQILASTRKVLGRLGRPTSFLRRSKPREIFDLFAEFKHRFSTGEEISSLLVGIKRSLETHGSLEQLFAAGLGRSDDSILPALARFVERLRDLAGGPDACASLLSSPRDGSACKRLNLYLRWMVRRDDVDPGPWAGVSPALLVVPLDTHLFRIAGGIGLTRRRQPNLKTAVEVTKKFAELCPDDPVRYDFSLTRLAINPVISRVSELSGVRARKVASSPTTSAKRPRALSSWLGK